MFSKKKLSVYTLVILLMTVLVSCNRSTKKDDLNNTPKNKLSPEAPVETKLLGQLSGTWEAEQSFINRDGK